MEESLTAVESDQEIDKEEMLKRAKLYCVFNCNH
jgi:hypothetical protein